MLKMLKIGCLSKITVSQVCLKVSSCNFLLNSGESQVNVTSFTHIHSGLLYILLFPKFQTWKILKMLKISCFECFKQNYCISGMPQGIPMQFFAQQLWKSGYCDQFHTYSQWFDVNFFISKISKLENAQNALKKAVLSSFKQNYCISGMPQGIHMQFFAQQWWKSGYCGQFHTYSPWFAVNFIISKISIAGKCSKCLK